MILAFLEKVLLKIEEQDKVSFFYFFPCYASVMPSFGFVLEDFGILICILSDFFQLIEL